MTYTIIINVGLTLEKPLKRWDNSIVLMIKKEKNNHKINRLRAINICKADDSLILIVFDHTKQHTFLKDIIY